MKCQQMGCHWMMSVNEALVVEILVDEMLLDEMSFDEMACCH